MPETAGTAVRRLPRHWRLAGLAITASICLAVLAGGALLDWWQTRAAEARLQMQLAAEHVTLSETSLQAQLVPVIARPDLSIMLMDLPAADQAHADELLSAALAVYPAGFLHRVADRIILAGNIQLWSGQEVGGLYFTRGLAVNCHGMVDDYVTRDLHHELSSLVREAATPPDAAWQAANPPGFHYMSYEAFRAMLADGTSDDTGSPLYAKGFVRAYGMTTLDNDYNTYAERMFADGPAFAKLLVANPALRPKARLVMASYLAVDGAMAGYFQRTGLQAAAAGP